MAIIIRTHYKRLWETANGALVELREGEFYIVAPPKGSRLMRGDLMPSGWRVRPAGSDIEFE